MSGKPNRLNDCLERLLRGEELDTCLMDSPEEADELRLLLKTVDGVRRYAETIAPRRESVAQSLDKLEKAYESKYFSCEARIAGILRPAARFAAVTVIAVVIYRPR